MKTMPFLNIIVIICISCFLLKNFFSLGINNDENLISNVEEMNSQDDGVINEKQAENSNLKSQDIKDLNFVQNLTVPEINMLKDLKERHDKLLIWEKELIDKENLLRVIDDSITNKMADLEKINKEVSNILREHKKAETKTLSGLVKVYENMKPQEAASIFEDLNMNTLIEVANQMQEVKLAPILAKMKPEKAREITIKLANFTKISALESSCLCD